MNKNFKIIIGIVAVMMLILIIINIIKENSNTNIEKISTENENTLSEIKYAEDTGEYYILDKETGKVIHTAETEEELYIYTIDLDYDPKLPIEDTIENEVIE